MKYTFTIIVAFYATIANAQWTQQSSTTTKDIPAVPLSDSIRKADPTATVAVDRTKYCIVQTPQCFNVDTLKKAYTKEYKITFTDDASVVESLGEVIHLIDGTPDKIKITTPMDLAVAEALLGYQPFEKGK